MSNLNSIAVKSAATITEQLDSLKKRGCLIEDEKKARSFLETVNYYRLSNYFEVFSENQEHNKERNEDFKPNFTFEKLSRLYEFDRRLRVLVLAALEEVEIAVRAAVSNYHAMKHGALGYLDGDKFGNKHNHRAFVNKITVALDKNRDLPLVRHHNQKYSGRMPLWVMMELFSFGALTCFYQDLKLVDKEDIAGYYFETSYRRLENWLQAFANLRNKCAHYNRIYGAKLSQSSQNLKPIEIIEPRKYLTGDTLFDYLLAIKIINKRSRRKNLEEENKTENESVLALENLFKLYEDAIDIKVLGFPEDWKDFLN